MTSTLCTQHQQIRILTAALVRQVRQLTVAILSNRILQCKMTTEMTMILMLHPRI